jgi:hypothetical protein
MNGREYESEELLCCSAMEVTEIGAHLPPPFVVTSITEVLLAVTVSQEYCFQVQE